MFTYNYNIQLSDISTSRLVNKMVNKINHLNNNWIQVYLTEDTYTNFNTAEPLLFERVNTNVSERQ